LGSIEISAADIHRLIGQAKGSAPDPAAFSASSHRKPYGEVVVERVVTDAIRVTTTPQMRNDVPAVVPFRVERGCLNVSRPGGKRFSLASGECFLIFSTGQYDYLVEEGVYSQVLVPLALFAPASIADILAAVDTPTAPSAITMTVWGAIDALINAPDESTPDSTRDQALEDLVAGLVAQAARHIVRSNAPQTAQSPVLAAALLYLDEHLTEPDLDLDAMAEALGTSTRTLHREFWAIGTSPIAALRNARLAAVARKLTTKAPPPSLDALAREHGYSDRTALTRAFRRRFGISPMDHRRRIVPFPG